jgi:hypothetical protein
MTAGYASGKMDLSLWFSEFPRSPYRPQLRNVDGVGALISLFPPSHGARVGLSPYSFITCSDVPA